MISLFIQNLAKKQTPKILLLKMVLTKYSSFKATYILQPRKRGTFLYQLLKTNKTIHKGAIRAAHPYYTIYRELAPAPQESGSDLAERGVRSRSTLFTLHIFFVKRTTKIE